MQRQSFVTIDRNEKDGGCTLPECIKAGNRFN